VIQWEQRQARRAMGLDDAA